ncbi:MAG: CocE/NonD family hydrolase [Acidimicrobiales bacterium]|nr:CocE/NonD family hydrolase [Acidimicrobiales bacterium]
MYPAFSDQEPARPSARRLVLLLALVMATLGAACSSTAGPTFDQAPPAGSDDPGTIPRRPSLTATTAVPLPRISLALEAAFGQLSIRDADPDFTIVARDVVTGKELARDRVEPNGTALLRTLPKATIEVLVSDGTAAVASAGTIVIPGQEAPPQDSYDEAEVGAGYNYIKTRDGTLLSAYVTLPAGNTESDGPFPTLVEYSGYEPSNPDAVDPARLILPLLGYALVQVNVRGTGCSGGSFDAFAEIERLDGYDVIETVAAQEWSSGVGMWGISYPGIMQLHVAAAQPPSLAAIAPLSVIANVDDVLYPGGLFNNGFGQSWTQRVTGNAGSEGQRWSSERIDAGDAICAANQTFRIHNPDLVTAALNEPFSTNLSRSRSPESFVDQIEVPTFIAGAWQDEQTGGGFPAILDNFTAAPVLRASLYNGLHIDPLGPDTLVPLLEFYDLFVARRAPSLTPLVNLVVSAGTASFFGQPLELPESRLTGLSYDDALAIYQNAPPITVLYEVGAEAPNLPLARFQASYGQWPIPQLEPLRLTLSDTPMASPGASLDGSLLPQGDVQEADPPAQADARIIATFHTDPAEGAMTTAANPSIIWGPNPGWDWPLARDDRAARFVSAPLEKALVLTGNASADLLVRLPDGEPDADLEVTLSSLDLDGNETYLQSGWLRLSRRALRSDATELNPQISNTASDIRPVARSETVRARVAILPFAAVIRPGEQLILTIDTPGASKPEWAFAVDPDPVTVAVLAGSSVALPVVPESTFMAASSAARVTGSPVESLTDAIGADSPRCGSLRGQPCRSGG